MILGTDFYYIVDKRYCDAIALISVVKSSGDCLLCTDFFIQVYTLNYRNQVYTLNEIRKVINEFGLPQVWNFDGNKGPERYIEVQIWDDKPLSNWKVTKQLFN